eukprot:SAG25_NODE_3215_length_1170_cov_1.224090_1_plen_170_part_10
MIGPILTPAQCAAQAGYQLPANCCCDAVATPPIDTPAHSAMRQRQFWLDGGSAAAPCNRPKLPSSAEGARSFTAMADAKPVWTFEGGAPIPLSPAINVPGSLVFAAVESTGVVGFGGRQARHHRCAQRLERRAGLELFSESVRRQSIFDVVHSDYDLLMSRLFLSINVED